MDNQRGRIEARLTDILGEFTQADVTAVAHAVQEWGQTIDDPIAERAVETAARLLIRVDCILGTEAFASTALSALVCRTHYLDLCPLLDAATVEIGCGSPLFPLLEREQRRLKALWAWECRHSPSSILLEPEGGISPSTAEQRRDEYAAALNDIRKRLSRAKQIGKSAAVIACSGALLFLIGSVLPQDVLVAFGGFSVAALGASVAVALWQHDLRISLSTWVESASRAGFEVVWETNGGWTEAHVRPRSAA